MHGDFIKRVGEILAGSRPEFKEILGRSTIEFNPSLGHLSIKTYAPKDVDYLWVHGWYSFSEKCQSIGVKKVALECEGLEPICFSPEILLASQAMCPLLNPKRVQ